MIVRDAAVLGRAFEVESGAYDRERLVPVGVDDTGSPFDELGLGTPDFGVDFSAPARGLAVWAILREIGSRGVRERIVRHNDCARRVAELARAADELELLAEPVLSICCFRYRPRRLERRGATRRAQRGDPARRPRPRPNGDVVDAGRRRGSPSVPASSIRAARSPMPRRSWRRCWRSDGNWRGRIEKDGVRPNAALRAD